MGEHDLDIIWIKCLEKLLHIWYIPTAWIQMRGLFLIMSSVVSSGGTARQRLHSRYNYLKGFITFLQRTEVKTANSLIGRKEYF